MDIVTFIGDVFSGIAIAIIIVFFCNWIASLK